MSHWQKARVASRIQWEAAGLFSLQIEAPSIRFTAGQFSSLALPALAAGIEPMVARPYSFVNAPGSASHEFLIVELPQGPLSPRLARLREGDDIWIGHAYGFFICDEVPAASTLWMMATGTGIAPFLSMLRTQALWEKFEHVVLVQGVRREAELVYREVVSEVRQKWGGRFSHASFISRESINGYCMGRITTALANGELERTLGHVIDKESSQLMLCGNPAMVDEVQALLGNRGIRRHRKRAPGQITVETYW